ncbi:hypothetical protein ACFE04_006879 [Oxalis oulophora]
MRVEKSVTLIYTVVVVLLACRSTATLNDPFYGISPQDEKYYKSSGDTIKCRDGSKKFTISQLNDDFCDCPDGSDEPGTSACPNGKMYCKNVGHIPLTLFSSRVNDGICDCCDGSDEYDGKVNCPNTCWEAGKVARDRLNKKIVTYQEGVVLRKQEIEKAKLAIAKDEAELSKLKNEEKILKGLVEQLKQRKEQIEKAEEKERLEKEKEEKEKREAEEANKAESDANQEKGEHEKETIPLESTQDDKTDPLDDPEEVVGNYDEENVADVVEHATSKNVESPVGEAEQHSLEHAEDSVHAKSKDDSVSSDHTSKLVAENDVPETTDGLSKEELGRLVASRWTGKNSEEQTEKVGTEDSNHESEGHDETPKDSEESEEDERYASDSDDDTSRYDDDDTGKYDEANLPDENEESFDEEHDDATSYRSEYDDNSDPSDTSSTDSPSWLEKIQQTVRNLLQAVNLFQTPVDKSEAAHIRKEYDESSAKLSKISSRISSLTQKLKRDFGPEKEFYSLYGQCFESKQNKYVYKVCPYKQATQEEGHSTSRLGQWDKFEDSYRVMVFSNGDKCWNGPDRSLKARLRCGLKNELTDIDEPSRCEYAALLSTPSVCVEEKLKELQEKLDRLLTEEPGKHDEL